MSKEEKYYSEKPMARTLEEIRKCAHKQSYSCVHPPLLNVPLENIVLDELHLMLRITGRPIENLTNGRVFPLLFIMTTVSGK